MLPTFFGPLLGIQSQGVKATASARVAAANGTNCLRPFAIPDFFWDGDGDGVFTLPFEVSGDEYYPPTSDSTGSGYAPGYDPPQGVGTDVVLKDDAEISSGNFRLLSLHRPGGNDVGDVIKACSPTVYAMGDSLGEKNGNDSGIGAAMADVYDLDSGARWENNKIVNSCVDTHSCQKYVWDSSGNVVVQDDPSATVSPRVLVLPLYDPEKEAIALQSGPNNDDLEIVNFVGFFYTYLTLGSTGHQQFHGNLVTLAGVTALTTGSQTVSLDSAFLKTIQLIR